MLLAGISRFILGATFLFSGFTKCVDPQGFAYSISEYLYAFGLDSWTNLAIYATALVILLELTTGLSLWLNYKAERGATLAFVIMFLFTGLTFAIAVTDKVEDCGCFGSTITLTNWQTFFKNIILMIPATYLFLIRERLKATKESFKRDVVFMLLIILGCKVGMDCYENQPLIGMSQYAEGAKIEPILHKEMNGTALIQVIPDLNRVTPEIQDEFNKLFMYCNERGLEFYAYTSSSLQSQIEYMRSGNMPYEFNLADEMGLKNLMRPKAGLVAVTDGVIIGKWSYNSMPSLEKLKEKGVVECAIQQSKAKNYTLIVAVALLVLLLGTAVAKRG